MTHRRRFTATNLSLLIALVIAGLSGGECRGAQETDAYQPNVETRAASILNQYCFRCHRGRGSSAGRYAFDARRAETMIDEGMIVPGEPEQSQLLDAVSKGRMPPRNQAGLPRPSADEVDLLRHWVQAGATEFPPPKRRPFMSLQVVMNRIAAHYRELDPRVVKDYRYFTLANLWNDPAADDRHLRMTRAALAKTLNSLSWSPELYVPQTVDAEGTIFAIDLKALGWTREHWNALVDEYPYEVDVDAVADDRTEASGQSLRQLEAEMTRLAGNDRMLKHLRADWFVTVGLRPKLYHRLTYELVLPELQGRPAGTDAANPKSMTDRDLEAFLGVDVTANINGRPATAKRAGFSESGISSQNRMIERHPLPRGGYYWKSYDFLGSNARAIVTEFPLGPRRNADDEFAFVHDGGEIIFSLPNGLQGYLLANAPGLRLDAGPIEIVGDALKTSGNQLIVSGLSCVVCHRRGLVDPPPDEVRYGAAAFGDVRERVDELYPEADQMRQLIDADAARFAQANDKLLAPFLLAGDDQDSSVDELPEPVGEVARKYLLEPMGIDAVASELYYADPDSLRAVIAADARARQVGLGSLRSRGGTIKREAWQNREGRSLMQQASEVLGYSPAPGGPSN